MHRASYDRYHDACKASGALVLHGCGFDSVPSDIGAFLAAGAMRERHDCGCSLIKMYYGKSSGGFSGGTLATIIALISMAQRASAPPASGAPTPPIRTAPGARASPHITSRR